MSRPSLGERQMVSLLNDPRVVGVASAMCRTGSGDCSARQRNQRRTTGLGWGLCVTQAGLD